MGYNLSLYINGLFLGVKKNPDPITFDPNFTWDIQVGESSTKFWESSIRRWWWFCDVFLRTIGCWRHQHDPMIPGPNIGDDHSWRHISWDLVSDPRFELVVFHAPFCRFQQHISFYGMGLYMLFGYICMLLRCRCKSWISDVQKLKAWPILNYMHPFATKKINIL